ncbi:hypothetical protein Tco_1023432, partial [Tanacetum coccineum]
MIDGGWDRTRWWCLIVICDDKNIRLRLRYEFDPVNWLNTELTRFGPGVNSPWPMRTVNSPLPRVVVKSPLPGPSQTEADRSRIVQVVLSKVLKSVGCAKVAGDVSWDVEE